MNGATHPQPTKQRGSFDETVRDFWATRPRRPSSGRKLAGVAAAIGDRYDVDPVLIRVIFVAITPFGGIGPLLYVLGWLFFPAANDEVSAFEGLLRRGRSSISAAFTIFLCLTLIPLSGIAFAGGWFGNSGWFGGSGFIAIVLAAAGLYLLHRDRAHLGHHRYPTPSSTTDTTTTTGVTAHVPPDTHPQDETMTNSVDPQVEKTPSPEAKTQPTVINGASEAETETMTAATDWNSVPPPTGYPTELTPPPEPPAPRDKPRIGLITVGLALLVAGIAAGLRLVGITWFSAPHIVGLALAVVGLGLVVSAFIHGGKALVVLAIPLGVIGMGLTIVPPDSFRGGYGGLHAAPLSASEIKPLYQHGAGDVRLDLTQLPPDVPVNTEVKNGVGEISVLVPENSDVRFTCATTAGDVDCLGHRSQGVSQDPVVGEELGPDGPGGPQITLEISQRAGKIEVYRV